MSAIKVWDEAKDEKYKPYNFEVMKLNNKEFEAQLTNLGYAIATKELSPRVFNLTTYFLETEPRNYNAMYVRRCYIQKQLMEIDLNNNYEDIQSENQELSALITKYDLNENEIKYDAEFHSNTKQNAEVIEKQIALLQQESNIINNKIINAQEHKAFSLWQYKSWICETLNIINKNAQIQPNITSKTINYLQVLYDKFSGEKYDIDVPIDNVLSNDHQLKELPFFHQELIYQYLILLMDKKNYHCCNYLFYLFDNQYLRQDYDLLKAFFQIIEQEIYSDSKNNSMYTFLLKWYQIQASDYKDQLNIQKIIEQALNFCENQVLNESPYIYLTELTVQLQEFISEEQIQSIQNYLISQLQNQQLKCSQYPIQALYYILKQYKQLNPQIIQQLLQYISQLLTQENIYSQALIHMQQQIKKHLAQ